MKNPNWIFDELVLALDLYIASGRKVPGDNDLAVNELSILLNKFWQFETNKSETLRNPNGVRMKIMNFMRLDPAYTQTGRVGLSRGSKLEEIVWQDYADKPAKLSLVAKAIRDSILHGYLVKESISNSVYVGEIEAEEGRILTRIHQQRERSPKLVKTKRAEQLAKHGKLECEVCGFNFHAIYGERGEDFIECHHVSPLCALAENSKTSLSMLRLVCSNCHRMIHVKKPWLSIDELKEIMNRSHSPIFQ